MLLVGGIKKLILPLSAQVTEVKYFVPNEELFEVLDNAHKECGHAGRDIMIKALSNKYANVTRECSTLYLGLCEACHKKKKHPKKRNHRKTFAIPRSECERTSRSYRYADLP